MRLAPSLAAIAVLLGLSVLPTACRRHSQGPLPAGAVVFEGAGVALVPGDGWNQIREQGFLKTGAAGELCWPVLQGTNQFASSLIQVYVDRADRSGPKQAAQKLQQTLQKNPDLLKTSWRQEEFRGDQGVSGVHLWFNQKMELPQRRALAQTHIYIVPNQRRQNVTLYYVTTADREPPGVHQMIRQTLTLK